MDIASRVRIRKPDIEDALLQELVRTAQDRICHRISEMVLPAAFESIAVEIVCAMHNVQDFEGISQESVDTFSTNFVDDLLSAYEDDFEIYLDEKNASKNKWGFKLL